MPLIKKLHILYFMTSHVLPGTWHNEALKSCTCIMNLQGNDRMQEAIRCCSVPGPAHGLRHGLPSATPGPPGQAEGEPPEKVVRAAAGSALLKLQSPVIGSWAPGGNQGSHQHLSGEVRNILPHAEP